MVAADYCVYRTRERFTAPALVEAIFGASEATLPCHIFMKFEVREKNKYESGLRQILEMPAFIVKERTE